MEFNLNFNKDHSFNKNNLSSIRKREHSNFLKSTATNQDKNYANINNFTRNFDINSNTKSALKSSSNSNKTKVQNNHTLKVFFNGNKEYDQGLKIPKELNSLRFVHSEYGELSINGLIPVSDFRLDEIVSFGEECVRIDSDFLCYYNQVKNSVDSIYECNTIKIILNVKNLFKGKHLTESIKNKLSNLLIEENFLLSNINENLITIERNSDLFEYFDFKNVLDKYKNYNTKIVKTQPNESIQDNLRYSDISKINQSFFESKPFVMNFDNNIQELFYKDGFTQAKELKFIDIEANENYWNIQKLNRIEVALKDKNLISKVNHFSHLNKIIAIQPELKIFKNSKNSKELNKNSFNSNILKLNPNSEIKIDNSVFVNNTIIHFFSLYNDYINKDTLSRPEGFSMDIDSKCKTSFQEKCTKIVNDYVSKLLTFQASENSNTFLFHQLQKEIDTMILLKYLFLNPQTSKRISAQQIVPIFGKLERSIRKNLLVRWLMSINLKELNYIKFNDKGKALLYYFLTFQDKEYKHLCYELKYEELAMAINSDNNDPNMKTFLEEKINYNQFPEEIKIIYDIAYLGKFDLLIDFISQKKLGFNITWKQILLIVLRYYTSVELKNTDPSLDRDISKLFIFANTQIEKINKKLNSFKFEEIILDLNYYLIYYFCLPEDIPLNKLSDMPNRCNKYSLYHLPLYIYSILALIVDEIQIFNSDDDFSKLNITLNSSMLEPNYTKPSFSINSASFGLNSKQSSSKFNVEKIKGCQLLIFNKVFEDLITMNLIEQSFEITVQISLSHSIKFKFLESLFCKTIGVYDLEKVVDNILLNCENKNKESEFFKKVYKLYLMIKGDYLLSLHEYQKACDTYNRAENYEKAFLVNFLFRYIFLK